MPIAYGEEVKLAGRRVDSGSLAPRIRRLPWHLQSFTKIEVCHAADNRSITNGL